MLKQPLMWTIAKKEDLVVPNRITPKLTPAPRNDGSDPCDMDSFQDSRSQLFGIVYNNTTEAYVYWGWAIGEELVKRVFGFVRWCFAEEEATNIYKNR
jgi:hypothetical protein